MKSTFKSEQEANDYKAKHKLFVRVAEKVGPNKWALNFPLECHVEVRQPHSNDTSLEPNA